jgi:hypothetical protein
MPRSLARATRQSGGAQPRDRKTGSLAFLLTESQHVLLSDPNMALLLRGATAVSERG